MPRPSSGPHSVQVDGSPSAPFDSTGEDIPPRPLFRQEAGLEVGSRDGVRVVDSRFSDRTLGIGYAVVRRSPSARDSQAPEPPPAPPSSPSSPPLSGGAIAGIVICVVLSISLILLGVFIWRRREKSQASSSKTSRRRTIDIETLQIKHSFGTGPVIHHTPSLPALPPLRIPSPSNSIMISVSPIESDSDAEGDNKPLTPLNVDSGAMVLVPHGNSSDGHHGVGVVSESDAGPSAEFLSGVRGEVKGKQVLGVASRTLRPPKMTAFDGDSNRLDNGRQSWRPLPKPRITLNDGLQCRTSLPPDLGSVRMQVQGRVQDYGPAHCVDSFFAVSGPNTPPGDEEDLLPPDYYQATQPFPDSMSVSAHGQGPISPSSPVHSLSLHTQGQ